MKRSIYLSNSELTHEGVNCSVLASWAVKVHTVHCVTEFSGVLQSEASVSSLRLVG